MKPWLLAFVAVAALLGAVPLASAQEPGDTVSVNVAELLIGQRATLEISVRAPAAATVEVDTGAASWNGVSVVSVTPLGATPDGSEAVHRFSLVVAPFRPGPGTFEPAVAIIEPGGASLRTLPPVSWTVVPSLAQDAPLELSPLPEPREIAGAESPLLRPAIALAAVLALGLLGTALFFLVRMAVTRARNRPQAPEELAEEPAGFDGVEPLLDRDPVGAYRALSNIVRGVIGSRYGLPAGALTTAELRARMESSGADRFQARLVGGFLEECDAVVYAGYRPAGERRRADLNMAREIVEATG